MPAELGMPADVGMPAELGRLLQKRRRPSDSVSGVRARHEQSARGRGRGASFFALPPAFHAEGEWEQ
jgi:hypothetical protein